MKTAKELKETLSAAGVSDAAASLVIRATSESRRVARMQSTLAAAFSAATSLVGGEYDKEQEREKIAFMFLLLDLFGVGGVGNVTGAKTARLLQPSGCSGAWNARDALVQEVASKDAIKYASASTISPETIRATTAFPSVLPFAVALATAIITTKMGETLPKHQRGARVSASSIAIDDRGGTILIDVEGGREVWVQLLNELVELAQAQEGSEALQETPKVVAKEVQGSEALQETPKKVVVAVDSFDGVLLPSGERVSKVILPTEGECECRRVPRNELVPFWKGLGVPLYRQQWFVNEECHAAEKEAGFAEAGFSKGELELLLLATPVLTEIRVNPGDVVIHLSSWSSEALGPTTVSVWTWQAQRGGAS